MPLRRLCARSVPLNPNVRSAPPLPLGETRERTPDANRVVGRIWAPFHTRAPTRLEISRAAPTYPRVTTTFRCGSSTLSDAPNVQEPSDCRARSVTL